MTVKCMVCGISPAYIGLLGNSCECSNPKCKCYSPELYPADPAEEIMQAGTEGKKTTLTEEELNEGPKQKPVWIWRTHHYDFGDV